MQDLSRRGTHIVLLWGIESGYSARWADHFSYEMATHHSSYWIRRPTTLTHALLNCVNNFKYVIEILKKGANLEQKGRTYQSSHKKRTYYNWIVTLFNYRAWSTAQCSCARDTNYSNSWETRPKASHSIGARTCKEEQSHGQLYKTRLKLINILLC